MRRLTPDTIAGRTLLVLIVGLTVSHLLSIALYSSDRTSTLMFTGGEQIGEMISTIGRLVENAPPGDRRRIAALADHPRLHVTWSRQSAIENQPDSSWREDVLRDALVASLNGAGDRVLRIRHTDTVAVARWQAHLRQAHQGAEPGETLMASLRLGDGSWLNFLAPVKSAEPFWSLRFVLSLVVMLLFVGALASVVVHYLTRPLRTFAHAAHRLGTDVRAAPIPLGGPAEVRHAVRAFNEMQQRIRRFVEDRTQMLAAISHDLGTPITRMRLRAEFVEDATQRAKMLADLDDMEKMVFSALAFARNEAADEPPAMVDLRALVQRVCDDAADAGHSVTLEPGDDALPYSCRPAALRRALANLVDNAVKYGHQARVSLQGDRQGALIRIDDNGPGIPQALQEEAFKPFHRLEGSRNRETGGTGLGLTVARTTVRAHGGEVTLANRREGGLRVEVRLP